MSLTCPRVRKIIISSKDESVKDAINKINKSNDNDIKLKN